jgi:hypothetical protein
MPGPQLTPVRANGFVVLAIADPESAAIFTAAVEAEGIPLRTFSDDPSAESPGT